MSQNLFTWSAFGLVYLEVACQLSLGLSLDPEVQLDKRVVPLKQGKEQEGPSPKDSPRTHDNRLLVCSNVDLS